MVIAGIEGIVPALQQFPGFDGLIGFVGVHRPALEIVRAQPERGESQERERQPAKQETNHESGVPEPAVFVTSNVRKSAAGCGKGAKKKPARANAAGRE